jgi:hypothetical protein
MQALLEVPVNSHFAAAATHLRILRDGNLVGYHLTRLRHYLEQGVDAQALGLTDGELDVFETKVFLAEAKAHLQALRRYGSRYHRDQLRRLLDSSTVRAYALGVTEQDLVLPELSLVNYHLQKIQAGADIIYHFGCLDEWLRDSGLELIDLGITPKQYEDFRRRANLARAKNAIKCIRECVEHKRGGGDWYLALLYRLVNDGLVDFAALKLSLSDYAGFRADLRHVAKCVALELQLLKALPPPRPAPARRDASA